MRKNPMDMEHGNGPVDIGPLLLVILFVISIVLFLAMTRLAKTPNNAQVIEANRIYNER